MDRALRNALEMLDVDLPLAVRLVSTNPAQLLGLGQSKGRLDPSFDADLVLLDQQLEVRQTWVAGRSCFKK